MASGTGAKLVKQATIAQNQFSQQFIIDGTGNFDASILPNTNFGFLAPSGPVNNQPWYRTIVKPANQQGNVLFGITKTIQVALGKQQASSNAAGTAYVIPGRVLLYVPSSGQVIFYPTKLMSSTTLATIAGNPTLWEHYNDIVPVVIPEGGQIEVWMEQDDLNGGAVAPSSVLNLTLFNFEFRPIGRIAVTD